MDDLKQRLERYQYFPGDGLMEGHTGDWVRYDQAAAALDAKDAEIARLRDQLRLIELLGYREGEQMGWLVAHMRGVAYDALEGRTSSYMWRLFPHHRAALDGKEA